jgi:CelD/BcsL family acetyltransferase involved in cellulose biosynthesis
MDGTSKMTYKPERIQLDKGWDAEIYRQWAFSQEVIERWNALAYTYGDTGVFLSHSWFDNWWKAFGKEGDLFTVLMIKDGEVKAIFPCYIKGASQNGLKNYYIASLTNDHSCYYDFIIEPEATQIALQHFAQLLHKIYPNSQLLLEYINTTTADIISFARELRQNYMPVYEYNCPSAPYAEVSGSWEVFHDNLSSRLKNTLKKSRKKAESNGKLHFEIIKQSEQLDEILDALFEVEYNSWKGKEGTAIKCQKEVEYFYRQLAYWAMRQDFLLIFILKLDDIPMSSYLCLHSGHTVFGIKMGYDESFHHFSPGNLLFYEMFRYLFQNPKVMIFNFLGICDSWKMEWTSKTNNYGWIRVYPKSLKGWSLYAIKYAWKNYLSRFQALKNLKSWVER